MDYVGVVEFTPGLKPGILSSQKDRTHTTRRAGEHWGTHCCAREHHHALVTPADVESWYQGPSRRTRRLDGVHPVLGANRTARRVASALARQSPPVSPGADSCGRGRRGEARQGWQETIDRRRNGERAYATPALATCSPRRSRGKTSRSCGTSRRSSASTPTRSSRSVGASSMYGISRRTLDGHERVWR